MALDNGKWKQIFRVHNIGVLYAYWRSLIDPRLDELNKMIKHKTPWDVLDDADSWATTIDAIDPGSTYSRYPSVRNPAENRSKSPFKETPLDEIHPADAPPDKYVMALLIENADHEVTKAYVSTKGEVQDKEYMEALEAMADMLNNYHAMMGFELTGGF